MNISLKYVAMELGCFGSECSKECGHEKSVIIRPMCPGLLGKEDGIEDEIWSPIDHKKKIKKPGEEFINLYYFWII